MDDKTSEPQKGILLLLQAQNDDHEDQASFLKLLRQTLTKEPELATRPIKSELAKIAAESTHPAVKQEACFAHTAIIIGRPDLVTEVEPDLTTPTQKHLLVPDVQLEKPIKKDWKNARNILLAGTVGFALGALGTSKLQIYLPVNPPIIPNNPGQNPLSPIMPQP